ncbi:MAG: hypothetical protein ACREUT_12095 [Steroidobacteraceae bacterium]
MSRLHPISDRSGPAFRSRAEALASDWERVSLGSLSHAAGCGCATGASLCLVSVNSVQADLLEFLVARCLDDADAHAAALVAEQAQRLKDSCAVPFADWIRRLPESALPAGSLDCLLDRIATFIESLRPSVGGGYLTPS